MSSSSGVRTQVFNHINAPTLAKMESLGARLKKARLRRGWSCRVCAEISGISTTTLKNIEKGDPSVGFGFYAALLQTYGLAAELDLMCLVSTDGISSEEGTERVEFDHDL